MSAQPGMRIPHGVADAQAQLAYVAGPGKPVIALDLARGEVVARSDFSARPLVADGDLLVAWSPVVGRPAAIRLIAARRHGDQIVPAWEATLELPDWVDLESAEPDAFTLDAEIREGVVVTNWTASARYRGGAPPSPDIEDAATHGERGTARFDRETGATLGVEDRSEVPFESAELSPEAVPDRRVVAYRAGQTWSTRPWRAGKAESVLVKPKEGPGVAVARREASSIVEIKLSDDPNAEAAVTPDGVLIFVHEPGGDGRSWRVFSSATGEPIASLPFDPGTEWVAVVDDRVLYYVVEDVEKTRHQSLRCRSLRTGERMWSKTLGEVTLRAPPPPMP